MNLTIKLKNDDPTPPEYDAVAILNGGASAIIIDDHCYLVVNRIPKTDLFRPSAWIFPEALEALKTLPPPA